MTMNNIARIDSSNTRTTRGISDRTVCNTIESIAKEFGKKFKLAFANGGDQNNNICPERDICNQYKIELIDGLGDKIQSSSWLLKK